ncbi:caspase family protein [Treponema sp. OttesenSCG-928-L16]|nr:caspase family protein [Treponema sp. OttesenSCG-928-L16]
MKRILLSIIVLCCFFSPLLFSQDRGLRVTASETLGQEVSIGKQWAVFIAIDRYKEWGPLDNPVRDAKEIKDILLRYYFIDEVRELYDQAATAENIRRLFINLRQEVGLHDSVFVFYAGHGHTDEWTNTGAWIPVDAGKNELAQVNWLPNIQIRNMLSALKAKHVFLVSDACFSGDILDNKRSASPHINSEYYRRAYSRTSRQVMTSGASETVPDSSEFSRRFKSTLLRAESACIDPEYIFLDVREVSSTQPMLGFIKDSEHQDGGSFLFFRRSVENTDIPAVAVSPAVPKIIDTAFPVVRDAPSKADASKLAVFGMEVIAAADGRRLNRDNIVANQFRSLASRQFGKGVVNYSWPERFSSGDYFDEDGLIAYINDNRSSFPARYAALCYAETSIEPEILPHKTMPTINAVCRFVLYDLATGNTIYSDEVTAPGIFTLQDMGEQTVLNESRRALRFLYDSKNKPGLAEAMEKAFSQLK